MDATEVAEIVQMDTASLHPILVIAATNAAIAIAVTGLELIVFQRWLWLVGIAIGILATGFLVTCIFKFVG